MHAGRCQILALIGRWVGLVGFALALGGGDVACAGSLVGVAEELDVNYCYTGDAATAGAGVRDATVDEHNADVKFVVSPQVTKDWLLRIGAEWQRFSFGVPTGVPVPATLQQASAVIGCDYQLGSQWIVRAECQPGVYSDFAEITGAAVDAPLMLGGVYLANPHLQWMLGLRVDVRSQYPVLPAAGVRWKYASEWTLDFMLPKPRLEYDWTDQLQLYLGAGLDAGAFRVGNQFGTGSNEPKLNHAVVDYYEFRVGAGLSWKITRTVRLEVETGAMLYRDFDFFTPDINYRSHNAPYGQIVCHGRF